MRLGWFAAVLYMAGIYMLSSVPGEDLPLPQFPFSDKLAHLITYAFLGVLIAFRSGLTDALRGRAALRHAPWTKGGWIALAVGVCYAAFDEIHQSYVPNRDMSLGDFLADLIGLALGFWLARWWDKRRVARLKR